MIKNCKGITLIALIITIIVMLVLSGLTISMIFGEDGILKRAVSTKETTKIVRIEENIKLALSATRIYDPDISTDNLEIELAKYFVEPKVTKNGENYTIEVEGYTFIVNNKGEIIERIGEGIEEGAGGETSGENILPSETSEAPETIIISGTITWDDNNNKDEKRPESITVKLLNGETEVETKTVTADNEWKYSFTDLKKYAEDGAEIEYTVSGAAVDGYTTTNGDGNNIIYAHTPETVINNIINTDNCVSVGNSWISISEKRWKYSDDSSRMCVKVEIPETNSQSYKIYYNNPSGDPSVLKAGYVDGNNSGQPTDLKPLSYAPVYLAKNVVSGTAGVILNINSKTSYIIVQIDPTYLNNLVIEPYNEGVT